MPEDFEKYFKMWEQGKISVRKAAEILNVGYSTFYRRCREQKQENREKKEKNCDK